MSGWVQGCFVDWISVFVPALAGSGGRNEGLSAIVIAVVSVPNSPIDAFVIV